MCSFASMFICSIPLSVSICKMHRALWQRKHGATLMYYIVIWYCESNSPVTNLAAHKNYLYKMHPTCTPLQNGNANSKQPVCQPHSASLSMQYQTSPQSNAASNFHREGGDLHDITSLMAFVWEERRERKHCKAFKDTNNMFIDGLDFVVGLICGMHFVDRIA